MLWYLLNYQNCSLLHNNILDAYVLSVGLMFVYFIHFLLNIAGVILFR